MRYQKQRITFCLQQYHCLKLSQNKSPMAESHVIITFSMEAFKCRARRYRFRANSLGSENCKKSTTINCVKNTPDIRSQLACLFIW